MLPLSTFRMGESQLSLASYDARKMDIHFLDTATLVPEVKPARVIPNGGARAWLQVLGAFFLYFNTWGLLSSYGAFETYYEASMLKSSTAFEISTIGSVQSFLLVFLGFFTGPIYDAGYYRYLLGVGSFLIVLGTLMQSLCTEFWQLLIAQGFCIGAGCGCLSIMSVAVTALWFDTKLTIANGIAACGSGVGGIVFPVIVQNLLPILGFPWTVRLVALIVAISLVICNVVLRGTGVSDNPRALVDRKSLTDWPYVTVIFAYLAVFLGLYTPFYYVQSYAVGAGIVSEDMAFYLLVVLNGASIVGRIIPSIRLADMMGPLNMVTLTAAALSITCLGFIGVTSKASLYTVTIVYGFFTGTFFALQPTVFVRLTGNMSVMGTRFGMAFSIMSFGLLVGSPISGQLQSVLGSYTASWVWASITLAVGTFLLVLARYLKVGSQLKIKI